jgi:hypothetical protein
MGCFRLGVVNIFVDMSRVIINRRDDMKEYLKDKTAEQLTAWTGCTRELLIAVYNEYYDEKGLPKP